MTEPTPSTYSIEKLLSQSVQPFPDLPPEEAEVLKESIRARGLLNPILLTGDGYLFDGHQRLKALLALGRKRIGAEHVKVMENVTRENMLGNAYASNMVRRMLTTADKAARMYQCAAMGWTQKRIAKEFHMSQPGVSQLMAAYPPEDGLPAVIVTDGEDGKQYTRTPRPRPAPPRPWEIDGVVYKAVTRARAVMAKYLPVEIDDWSRRCLIEELARLRDDIDGLLEKMETMSPAQTF